MSIEQWCEKMDRLRGEAWTLPWTDIEIADIEHGAETGNADQQDVEFVLAVANANEAMVRVVRAAWDAIRADCAYGLVLEPRMQLALAKLDAALNALTTEPSDD